MAKRWQVIYRVKHSERWCADECDWVEAVGVVEAANARAARRRFREGYAVSARRVIWGRHVSTRKV